MDGSQVPANDPERTSVWEHSYRSLIEYLSCFVRDTAPCSGQRATSPLAVDVPCHEWHAREV